MCKLCNCGKKSAKKGSSDAAAAAVAAAAVDAAVKSVADTLEEKDKAATKKSPAAKKGGRKAAATAAAPSTPQQPRRSGRKSPGRMRQLRDEQQKADALLEAMNTFDQKQLISLPGMGTHRVKAVLTAREADAFTSVDDFAERTGCKGRTLQSLLNRIIEYEA